MEARYYLRENLDILIDSLLRAWSIHGASRELYLDHAKIYHARALTMACLALNIRLMHRGVGDPPPGGLIERFFETAQRQLEAEVRAGPILTLARLNHALAAWLEVSYHERPHSETKQPPRVRYEQGRQLLRHVNIQEVLKYFLRREKRRVHADFSHVQLLGQFFRVQPTLRADWVEVRYDPYSELDSLLIYSLDGQYLGVGQRYGRQANSTALAPPTASAKPQHNDLDLLIHKHEESLRQRGSGIDYHAALAGANRRWPFVEFVKQRAAHLGRPGGLSAFRSEEWESLQKVSQRLTRLDANLLARACEKSQQRTIAEIAFLLPQLQNESSP